MTRCALIGLSIALAWLASPPAMASAEVRGGLSVSRVTVSSTMPPGDSYRYDARHLVDGDSRTSWQPAGRAPYFAWVRLELANPAQVDGLIVHNGHQHEDASGDLFTATARVRRAWVLFDDGSSEVIRLDPGRRGPRRVVFSGLRTTRSVTLVVRDFELGERWNHLAISEITVTGRPVPAESLASSPATGRAMCGSGGWVHFRDAVVRYCGDPHRASRCEDPVLDVVLRCRTDPSVELRPINWDDRGAGGKVRWSYPGRWFELTVEVEPDRGDLWRVSRIDFNDLTLSGR